MVTLLPPFNLTNLLYKKELETLGTEKYDKKINVIDLYSAPKWAWKIGAGIKDVHSIYEFIKNSTSFSDKTNNDTLTPAPQTKKTVWERIDEIESSEKYEKFLAMLKKTGDFGEANRDYGVTIDPTADATQMIGDQKLRRLRKVLSSPSVFGVTRGDIQVMFHEEFIRACLPTIYKGEWRNNFYDILRRNGIKSNSREVFIICPRRFGKTWSVAMFCAAFLWCIPNITISIFSRGKRMAQKLMLLCLQYLMRFKDFAKYEKGCNSEQIILSFGPNDRRVLCCFPGTAEVCFIIINLVG
jgi:hypothetical protein